MCCATPNDTDGFRDADGKIKRQVARFRIYATLASGEVCELTADIAQIEWRAEVGNLKAGWYEYHYPMDLPIDGVTAPVHRNANFNGNARDRLSIRPASRAISGREKVVPNIIWTMGHSLAKTSIWANCAQMTKAASCYLGGAVTAHRLFRAQPPRPLQTTNNGMMTPVTGPCGQRSQLIGKCTMQRQPMLWSHYQTSAPDCSVL